MPKFTLKPSYVDPQDRPFTHARLFGAASSFPETYNADLGLRMGDQNADSRETECTGYTVTDIAADQDGFLYSPDFNYMNTLVLMNVPPDTEGADLRVAFKVPVAVGMIPLDDQPPAFFRKSQAWAANPANWPVSVTDAAAGFRKPAYIPISPVLQDWFDTVRSALLKGLGEKRSVGVGTRWSQDFQSVGKDGVLTENPRNLVWGHAYKICGWKVIRGQTYLIAKTWQGPKYGDKGYVYMSRTLFNKLMSDWGAYAATLQDLSSNTVEELKSRNVTLFEVIIALLKNIYIKMQR